MIGLELLPGVGDETVMSKLHKEMECVILHTSHS